MTADDRDPAPPVESRPTVAASAVAELEALVRRIREMADEHERQADRTIHPIGTVHCQFAAELRGLLRE